LETDLKDTDIELNTLLKEQEKSEKKVNFNCEKI
jgi:hypothetical protein